MFIAETRVSTNLWDFQTRLDDLGKSHFNVLLSFERNSRLIDLQTCVEALGTLKCLEKEVQTSQKLVFLRYQIQSIRKANARLSEDKGSPYISSCVFMPNDYLVACDSDNCTIKLLDSSLSLQDSLKVHQGLMICLSSTTTLLSSPCPIRNSFSTYKCFLGSQWATSFS